MLVCHEAGGLAAQYRFGGRSRARVVFPGGFKLMLGLLFGETLLDLLPRGILGFVVVAAGLELGGEPEPRTYGRRVWLTGGGTGDGIRGQETQAAIRSGGGSDGPS